MSASNRVGCAAVLIAAALVGQAGPAAAFGLPMIGWPVYRAKPIAATVVDGETGAPLEGVIVDVVWELEGYWQYPTGVLRVEETVTDAQGRFHFPGWGPRLRPLTGRLAVTMPALLLFKPGYRYRRLHNPVRHGGGADLTIRSVWDGATIRLEPFEGTQGEYADHLSSLANSYLRFAFRHDDCTWRRIPRMLTAVLRQRREFEAARVTIWMMSESSMASRATEEKCGSFSRFLRESGL